MKLCGEDPQDQAEHSYGPAQCIGIRKDMRIGVPALLSAAPRSSKSTTRCGKICGALHYIFARIRQTIRCPPAMEVYRIISGTSRN